MCVWAVVKKDRDEEEYGWGLNSHTPSRHYCGTISGCLFPWVWLPTYGTACYVTGEDAAENRSKKKEKFQGKRKNLILPLLTATSWRQCCGFQATHKDAFVSKILMTTLKSHSSFFCLQVHTEVFQKWGSIHLFFYFFKKEHSRG